MTIANPDNTDYEYNSKTGEHIFQINKLAPDGVTVLEYGPEYSRAKNYYYDADTGQHHFEILPVGITECKITFQLNKLAEYIPVCTGEKFTINSLIVKISAPLGSEDLYQFFGSRYIDYNFLELEIDGTRRKSEAIGIRPVQVSVTDNIIEFSEGATPAFTKITVETGSLNYLPGVIIEIENSINYAGKFTIYSGIDDKNFIIETPYIEEGSTAQFLTYYTGSIFKDSDNLIDREKGCYYIFQGFTYPFDYEASDVRLLITSQNFISRERETLNMAAVREYSASGGWLEDQDITVSGTINGILEITFTSETEFEITYEQNLGGAFLGTTGDISNDFSPVADTFTIASTAWIPNPTTGVFQTGDLFSISFVSGFAADPDAGKYLNSVQIEFYAGVINYYPNNFIDLQITPKTQPINWSLQNASPFPNDASAPPRGGYNLGWNDWGSSKYTRPLDYEHYKWITGAGYRSPDLSAAFNEVLTNAPVEYGGDLPTEPCDTIVNHFFKFSVAIGSSKNFKFRSSTGNSYLFVNDYLYHVLYGGVGGVTLKQDYLINLDIIKLVENGGTGDYTIGFSVPEYIGSCKKTDPFKFLITEKYLSITTPTDCGRVWSGFAYSSNVWMGTLDSTTYSNFLRYNSDIPQGTQIKKAFVILFVTSSKSFAQEIIFDIAFEKTGEADKLLDYSDWAAAARTTEKVRWNIGTDLIRDDWIISPDIRAPLQEIIDQEDYAAGNNVNLLFDAVGFVASGYTNTPNSKCYIIIEI